MVEEFSQCGESILAVQQVPREKTDAYGIVAVDDPEAKRTHVNKIVEKPKDAVAAGPSGDNSKPPQDANGPARSQSPPYEAPKPGQSSQQTTLVSDSGESARSNLGTSHTAAVEPQDTAQNESRESDNRGGALQ